MFNKFSNRYFVPAIFILFYIFLAKPVSALTLSPPILDLSAAPGEVITPIVSLENETNSEIFLRGETEAFSPSANPGQAEFYKTEEGLPSWIKFEETEFVLASGENKKILLNITVPNDARPGSYYAAVFWSTGNPDKTVSGANITSRLGVLIFLRVEGTVTEKLELENFGTKKIFSSLPITLEAQVKNIGNVHLIPKGEIVIKTWTGKQVAAIPWNESSLRVLPGVERKIVTVWGNHKFFEELKFGIFGFYTASLHISYGSPIKEVGDIASFWILPWRSFSIALLALCLAVLAMRYGIGAYNRWIVKKHMRR